jgi:pimeloyl-ACP methyl ester carboxylesterase
MSSDTRWEGPWGTSDPWIKHVFEWLVEGLRSAGMEWADRAILWLTLGPEFHREPAYEGVLSLHGQRGQSLEALVRQLECDAAHDCLERLSAVTVPTLVIAGRSDVWFPLRYGQQLADSIPGARLEAVDGGHGFPIEEAEKFFSLLRAHVGGG